MTLTILAVAGFTVLFAKDNTTDAPRFDLMGSSVDTLAQRLSDLEEEVATLAKENRSLQESVARLESVTVFPKETWKKREFNGDTYYVIPASE